MPRTSRSIDEETIRTRCSSPEAAEYTLYLRRLVAQHAGGQAGILRAAAARGVLPHAYTRQTLSEHLSGRYRHGPPWTTAQLIIDCLPDSAPRSLIRNHAAALYAAVPRTAARSDNPERRFRGWDGQRRQSPNAGPVRPVGPRPTRTPEPGAVPAPVIPRQANQAAHGVGHRYGERPGRGDRHPVVLRDLATEVAELRAECARLRVRVALAEAGASRELTAGLDRDPRGRFGHLAERIDPTAPLPRRALAQYLCAYADLTATGLPELAVRAHLTLAAVAAIMAAHRAPTAGELARLTAVLGADPEPVRHLVRSSLAGSVRAPRRGPA